MNGPEIKALRDRLEWSQEQLAEYLGLDRSSVSRMEGGQEPSGPVLKLLQALIARQSDRPRNAAPRASA